MATKTLATIFLALFSLANFAGELKCGLNDGIYEFTLDTTHLTGNLMWKTESIGMRCFWSRNMSVYCTDLGNTTVGYSVTIDNLDQQGDTAPTATLLKNRDSYNFPPMEMMCQMTT